jgi:hypothetical protein
MPVARDLSIIVLAVESIIIGVMLAFLIIQIQRLITMLDKEIKPILDSTNETVSTVRGTTTFVTKRLISPVVEVASFFSGARRAAQMLTKWPGRSEATTSAPSGAETAPPKDDRESPVRESPVRESPVRESPVMETQGPS